ELAERLAAAAGADALDWRLATDAFDQSWSCAPSRIEHDHPRDRARFDRFVAERISPEPIVLG
ncbi:MAG: hypothetical protein IAG13_12965, partial [Deltaproteobacteria bacterium]|nr:hypothetical protein [Nannocystaceae bacterium]